MPVAFVSANNGLSADSVVDTSISTTVASSGIGDVNFCWINLTNGTATAPTVTAPSGWALAGSGTDGASPQLWFGLYYRVFQGGDSTTPSWSFSTGANVAWTMSAYSGIDAATPYTNMSVLAYPGTTATKTTDSVTTTDDGWICTGFGDRSGGVYSAATDTLRASGHHTVYSSPTGVYSQDSNGDVAAGSQSRTITGPSGTSVGSSYIFRLNPGAPVVGAPAQVAAGTGAAFDAHSVHSPLKEWMFDKGMRYVAHRGGSADYVEMTAFAYAQCDARKVEAIEISVWRTSDGVWVASHDQTTTRLFGTTVDIPANPYSSLTGLTTTSGGHPMATLTDLLDLYAATHIIFIDNKANNNITDFLDTLDAYTNATGHFVVKGIYTASATAVAARLRGYTTWGYYYDTDLGSLAATHGPWDILGLNYDATLGDWSTIKAVGKLVLAHVILSVAQAVTAYTKDPDGLMTGKVQGVIPTAVADPATGTGAAFGPSGRVALGATPALGSGVANAASSVVAPSAGLASGTGVANTPSLRVAPSAAGATGTGAASDGVSGVSSSATPALGTGEAFNAGTGSAVPVVATAALGSGEANDASVVTAVSALAEPALGTGAANNAGAGSSVSAAAGVASAAGVANNASVAVGIPVPAEVAAGSSEAFDASVVTAVSALAEPALGVGAANDAGTGGSVSAAVETATGMGAANDITPGVGASGGVAGGSGEAFDATVTTVAFRDADADGALGAGVALDPTITAQSLVSAGVATGSGAAFDASVTALAVASPRPAPAGGLGGAYDAIVVVLEAGTPAPSTTGSWYSLLDIYREASAWYAEDRSSPPVACPNDGEPLREGPQGQLYCPFDGWQPE